MAGQSSSIPTLLDSPSLCTTSLILQCHIRDPDHKPSLHLSMRNTSFPSASHKPSRPQTQIPDPETTPFHPSLPAPYFMRRVRILPPTHTPAASNPPFPLQTPTPKPPNPISRTCRPLAHYVIKAARDPSPANSLASLPAVTSSQPRRWWPLSLRLRSAPVLHVLRRAHARMHAHARTRSLFCPSLTGDSEGN